MKISVCKLAKILEASVWPKFKAFSKFSLKKLTSQFFRENIISDLNFDPKKSN
jgi:hypothetical protein